jgi:hypothetical protein
MAAVLPLESQRFLDCMTWDWQPLSAVLAETVKVIPPGKALRKYQQSKAASDRTRSGAGPTRPPLSEDEQIASGARSIARDRYNSFKQSGRIEIRVADGEEQVRFRSAVGAGEHCPTCGHVEQQTAPAVVPDLPEEPVRVPDPTPPSRISLSSTGMHPAAKVIPFPRRTA